VSIGDANHALMPLRPQFAYELMQTVHPLAALGLSAGEEVFDRLELGEDFRVHFRSFDGDCR